MQIAETWSISCEKIAAFFSRQADVRSNENGSFSFGQCEIRLTPLPFRQTGRLRLPQTGVAFDGAEADTEAIHHRFVLQFLSAGG